MATLNPRLGPAASLRLKLLGAFGSALLVLVVVWIGLGALDRTEAAQLWIDHAVQVRNHTQSVAQKLLDARLARATYLISGDKSLLDDVRDLRNVSDLEVMALYSLTVDNELQQQRLRSLAPYIEHEVASMEASLAYADASDRDGLVRLVLERDDRKNFQVLDATLELIAAEENRLIATRSAYAEDRKVTARVLLIASGGLAFLLAIFVINRVRTGVIELEQANAIIAEQAATLAERGAQLERLVKELDQFAYVASHDLRAPLRAIATLAHWIEEDAGDKLDDDGKEHLRLMVSRVARMEALVEGVLAYARAGRSPEATVDIAVGELVREVIDLLQPPEDVTVVVETPMPTLHGARVPLQQILMNLVSNAIKHGKRPGHVRIGARREQDHWVFYVADNGPGIDRQYHERIFTLFQTLEARDRVESTGIGLAVVKKLVEQHGGRIWVESEVGAGATFSFTYGARVGAEGRAAARLAEAGPVGQTGPAAAK